MGSTRQGVIALAVGAALLGGGVLGASAQDTGGPNDDSGATVPAGTLDDGQDLLPLAQIGIDQAIQVAQGAASGAIGEVDLEYVNGQLAFNVDVGKHDVKVDAANGSVLSVGADD